MNINELQDIVHDYMHSLPLKDKVKILSETLNVPVSCTPTGFYMYMQSLWSEKRTHEFCVMYIRWMKLEESEKIYQYMQQKNIV